MSARNRLQVLIAFTCLAAAGILLLAAVVAAGAANPGLLFPATAPNPLPNDCQDVTEIGRAHV